MRVCRGGAGEEFCRMFFESLEGLHLSVFYCRYRVQDCL